ncbi:MAG: prealbumin-like fold domain-containing protein [Defluviitaleaceae bacterium]|nr:prealbumin-like fold domain-containing protein [Defluviitaleaceae bacterium]
MDKNPKHKVNASNMRYWKIIPMLISIVLIVGVMIALGAYTEDTDTQLQNTYTENEVYQEAYENRSLYLETGYENIYNEEIDNNTNNENDALHQGGDLNEAPEYIPIIPLNELLSQGYTIMSNETGVFIQGQSALPGNPHWRDYSPPQSPILGHVVPNIYAFFVEPRYGYAAFQWAIYQGSATMLETGSPVRQLLPDPIGGIYYQINIQVFNPNTRVAMNFLKLELDADDIDFGVRIVGYTSPPISQANIINNTLEAFRTQIFPSVHTSDEDEPFPPIPPRLPQPGPDFNAIFDSQTSNAFRFNGVPNPFGLQPVDIRNTPSHWEYTLNMGVENNLRVGHHDDTVLLRHGPAQVGYFNLTFTVIRPITELLFDNQNQSTQEVSVTPTIRDMWDPNTTVITEEEYPLGNLPYTYANPAATTRRDRNQQNITVEILSPDDFTVFNGPSTCGFPYTDIEITPPQGYTEVSRELVYVPITCNDSGETTYRQQLVVVFAPIPVPTVNITRPESGGTVITIPDHEDYYPGFNQTQHVDITGPDGTTGRITIVIDDPPGGNHFNDNTTINIPSGYLRAADDYVDEDGNLHVVIHPAYEVEFRLNGGSIGIDNGPIIRNNRLRGFQIGTGFTPIATLDPTVTTTDFDLQWPQYGVPANPTRNFDSFLGWQELDSTGVPIGDILTPAQTADAIVTGRRIFEARWWTPEFIKTDMGLYEYPREINQLSGAEFAIYQGDMAPNGDPIYTTLLHTIPINNTDGRIVLNWNFSPAGMYILREINAPYGHDTPTGFWVIEFDERGVITGFAPHGNNPAFVNTATSECNLDPCECNPPPIWHVGNSPTVKQWPIYKTNWSIYSDFNNRIYLDGAIFSLYVYNGSGDPGHVLVTPDMVGPANEGYQWSYVITQTSNPNPAILGQMLFPMAPNRFYQLVEHVAPDGYRAPFGQWRISVEEAPILRLSITNIGDVPNILRPNPDEAIYYVGNRVDFDLPVSGGGGTRLIHFAGMAVIVFGMGLLVLFHLKRNKNVKISIHRHM